MLTRFSTVLLGVIILVLASPAFGAGELGPDEPPPNGAARRDLARDWLRVFSSLNSQIPDLSPSQREWLRREYDDQISTAGGRYTARALAAMDSLEYQLSIAKPHVSGLVNALSTLTSASPASLDREVALWTFVAYSLIDKGFWQSIQELIRRKVVGRRIGHVEDLYYENYVLQAQGILAKVVIPHLQGQLPN